MSDRAVKAAIVDYGFGNLRSVATACGYVGMEPTITSDFTMVAAADAVILPGIGAFGDAIAALRRLDLIDVLRDFAASGRPLMGVCLGAQLLLGDSCEFGRHEGLNIVAGSVQSLAHGIGERVKVPHVGWTGIDPARPWHDTMLAGVQPGACLYFTHSFYLAPAETSAVLSTSTYGGLTFCSSYQRRNVFGCQFHPERSAGPGLKIYDNLRRSCARPEQACAPTELIDAG